MVFQLNDTNRIRIEEQEEIAINDNGRLFFEQDKAEAI